MEEEKLVFSARNNGVMGYPVLLFLSTQTKQPCATRIGISSYSHNIAINVIVGIGADCACRIGSDILVFIEPSQSNSTRRLTSSKKQRQFFKLDKLFDVKRKRQGHPLIKTAVSC